VGPVNDNTTHPFLDYFSNYGVDIATDGAAPATGTDVTAHGSASSGNGTVIASTYDNQGNSGTFTHASGTALLESGHLIIVMGGGPSVSGAQTYSVNFELTAASGTAGGCSAVTEVTPSG